MKHKLTLILISILICGVLSACNQKNNTAEADSDVNKTNKKIENLNETGMPIVNESITFNMFAGSAASNPASNDWNDLFIWNEYEEMTNIKTKWERVMPDAIEEKRNLTLAADDLPDAFYAAGLSSLDLLKYGEQGTFIKLNDLIEEHAPNLVKLMDEYPELRQGLTMADGNIYSLPGAQNPDFISFLVGAKPFFNQEWLDKLDIEVPKTTEEFYDYLKSVKETDLNENGKHDEIPYGGRNIGELTRWLRGSFGLSEQNNDFIDLDPEGDALRFIPTSEAYKEMLIYINKLYEEELINQDIFTIENDKFLADGAEALYGSTVFYGPSATFGGEGEKYVGGIPLKGPHGDQSYSKVSVLKRVDGLVITKENKNPEAMIRWADYFFSEEGIKFQYMGVEGVTYEKASDGNLTYVDEIMNSPEGLTVDEEIRKRFAHNGIFPVGVNKQEYFVGAETTKESLAAAEQLEPYLPDTAWPNFNFTAEENKILTSTGADIEKYVNEMRDKFIAGSESFAEWDEYVKTIEKMGLEEYMKIQNAAYERYEKLE